MWYPGVGNISPGVKILRLLVSFLAADNYFSGTLKAVPSLVVREERVGGVGGCCAQLIGDASIWYEIRTCNVLIGSHLEFLLRSATHDDWGFIALGRMGFFEQ